MNPIDLIVLLLFLGLISWPFILYAKRKPIYAEYEVRDIRHSRVYKYEARLVNRLTGATAPIYGESIWGLKMTARSEARRFYRQANPKSGLPTTINL